MDLFSLAAKLTLDSEGFDKGIVGAEKSGKGLASSLEGTFSKIKKFAAGALSVAALKKGFDAVVDLANATSAYGDKVDKQSQALGLSRKAYQEWDYILGQNGASIDSLGVSMKTLNSLVLDAAAGGKESKNAFAQLGLGIHEIEQLEPEKQFESVVRAFQKMPAGARKSALAVKIFGRNGMELLPLLNQSSTSIDELRARAEELGIIMSDDAVDASVAYNDAMDDLNRTFNGLKYSVGAKLLPAFTTAVQKVTGFASKISKAFQENGIEGVWDTLVESFKDIKWPTWSDVKNAIETAWNTIVSGVKGLAKLVFGENVDGSIKWPTWEEVGEAIGNGWKGIVEGVSNLGQTIGKAVFGENVDGSIDWPTWDEIKSGVETAWKNIVDAVAGLGTGIGKVVFGQNVDGTIKWPTWSDISRSVESAWRGIVEGVRRLGVTVGKAIFGENVDGSVKIPTWDEISQTASTEWQKIKDGISAFGAIVIDFSANLLDDWFSTIKGWLDGSGLKDIGINFSATVAEWIERIWNWAQNGINIVTNFLNGNSGNSESGDWQSRQPSGAGPAETWQVGGFAKGLNYVPFDGFPALLHRGEQVVTASQARRNRGISGGSTGIDTGAIASAVSGAIRSAMEGVSVNSYLSGKDITDNVDRDMARKLKARRFAT